MQCRHQGQQFCTHFSLGSTRQRWIQGAQGKSPNSWFFSHLLNTNYISPSLWPSGIGSHLIRNRLWVLIPGSVGYISHVHSYNYLGPFGVLWVHMAWHKNCVEKNIDKLYDEFIWGPYQVPQSKVEDYAQNESAKRPWIKGKARVADVEHLRIEGEARTKGKAAEKRKGLGRRLGEPLPRKFEKNPTWSAIRFCAYLQQVPWTHPCIFTQAHWLNTLNYLSHSNALLNFLLQKI